MPNYRKILAKHYPDKKWTASDNFTYDQIDWVDEDEKPSKSTLDNLDENWNLTDAISNKLLDLDHYHFGNSEIRQCKINNYFVLQLSGEGRSLIQEQIALLAQKIKLNLVAEEDASFEYFYNGGSIEITLVQLRQLYVAMLDIVNSNYQNYKAETYLIKNLGSVGAVESHDFTVNYLKNQNINL